MLFNQFSSVLVCSFCVDEGKDREKTDRNKTYTMIFAKKLTIQRGVDCEFCIFVTSNGNSLMDIEIKTQTL